MENISKVSSFKAFRFMFGFVRLLPLYILGLFLYASQQLSFPLMISLMLSGLTAVMTGVGDSSIWIVTIQVVGFLVLIMATVGTGMLIYVQLGLKNMKRLQTKLLRVYINRSIEEREHSGSALASMNTDAQTAEGVIGNALSGFVMWALPIVVFGVAIFAVNWKLGLYTAVVGLLSVWAQSMFVKPLGRIAETTLSTIAKALGTVGDLFSGAVVIRAFRLQERMGAAFGAQNDIILKLGRREAYISAAQKLVTGVSSVLTTVGVFALGSLLISGGELTLVTLIALVPLCGNLSTGITEIGGAWVGMAAPISAAKRIYEVLSGDNRLDPIVDERYQPKENYELDINDLTFAYEGAEKPALENVSLRIPENEFAAFVGESGSGKSTLIRVIAGLYERDFPGISVGGMRLEKGRIGQWRANFAYVDQSRTLFNLTVAENIALGRADATRDEVIAAAVEADADEFIRAMPDGYDTPVGEVGGALSDGQRQRISIARALIRRAPILVFDEVTSALDKASEAEITATIDRLRGKHTILMVTHNLQAVSPDVVYRVESGGSVALQ